MVLIVFDWIRTRTGLDLELFPWMLIGFIYMDLDANQLLSLRVDLELFSLINEAISSLGLIEMPLWGKRFTWTNK